ncbi:hypothetical protein Tco_0654563 [Tanacetum coccineum]|uniref:Uncharacterized protein n=1 Tax=Tanacetum coccineum TaxID=301880 RepID=A0ABQ4X3K4_9ASTR
METKSERKEKEKVDVAHGKGIELLSDVALSEKAQMKEARMKSLRDFHKTHPNGSRVPGVTDDDSSESESESWRNDEDDSNNEQESSDESSKQENESEEQELDSKQDEESDVSTYLNVLKLERKGKSRLEKLAEVPMYSLMEVRKVGRECKKDDEEKIISGRVDFGVVNSLLGEILKEVMGEME